jgi:hypothetical protein
MHHLLPIGSIKCFVTLSYSCFLLSDILSHSTVGSNSGFQSALLAVKAQVNFVEGTVEKRVPRRKDLSSTLSRDKV